MTGLQNTKLRNGVATNEPGAGGASSSVIGGLGSCAVVENCHCHAVSLCSATRPLPTPPKPALFGMCYPATKAIWPLNVVAVVAVLGNSRNAIHASSMMRTSENAELMPSRMPGMFASGQVSMNNG